MKKLLYILPMVALCANMFAIPTEESLAKYKAYKAAQKETSGSSISDYVPHELSDYIPPRSMT